MNPVVGLDVAKGESQAQAFLDKEGLMERVFYEAYKEELDPFIGFLKEIEGMTGSDASGHS